MRHVKRTTELVALGCLLAVSIITPIDAQVVTRKAAGSENWTTAQSKLIRQAGKRLGVPVRTERMVHFAQASASWFAASAASLERTPATELPRGVNVGVAYFDLPGQKFPKGFYKMRVFADVKQVGQVDGRAQLINEKGKIVGELRAKVDVKSMTLPERPTSRLTAVTLCTGAACNIGGGTPPIVGFWACYACSNGFTVCLSVGFHDEFWD
jgi:hypothetical protein